MLFKLRKPKTKKEKKLQQELNEAFSYVRSAYIAGQLGIPHKYDNTRYEYCQKLIAKCQNMGMLPWWSEDEDKEVTQKLISLARRLDECANE